MYEFFFFKLSYVTYLLYKYCGFHIVCIYFYHSDFTEEKTFLCSFTRSSHISCSEYDRVHDLVCLVR